MGKRSLGGGLEVIEEEPDSKRKCDVKVDLLERHYVEALEREVELAMQLVQLHREINRRLLEIVSLRRG